MESPSRAIAHAALLTPSPLQRYQPGAYRREDHAAFTLFADDAAEDVYAIVLGAVSPLQFFARAAAFFDANAPYSVTIEVGIAAELEHALEGDHWQLDEEERALVMPHIPAMFPPYPSELAIRLVTDPAAFAAFHTITRTPPRFVPSLEAAMDPAVALLVGYTAGRPVATARLSCLGTIADVMGVTTVPDQRRRGYGTAMTWAAIAEGARRGCTAASLTATPQGYPVYLRMGFEPVGTFRTYVPTAIPGA